MLQHHCSHTASLAATARLQALTKHPKVSLPTPTIDGGQSQATPTQEKRHYSILKMSSPRPPHPHRCWGQEQRQVPAAAPARPARQVNSRVIMRLGNSSANLPLTLKGRFWSVLLFSMIRPLPCGIVCSQAPRDSTRLHPPALLKAPPTPHYFFFSFFFLSTYCHCCCMTGFIGWPEVTRDPKGSCGCLFVRLREEQPRDPGCQAKADPHPPPPPPSPPKAIKGRKGGTQCQCSEVM